MANLYAYCFVYEQKGGSSRVELGHFTAVSDAEAKGKASILFEETHPEDFLRSSLTHKCMNDVDSDDDIEETDNGYPKPQFTF